MVKDAALAAGQAKLPLCHYPWGPKGWEQCVHDGRNHSNGQGQDEGESGSVPTCAALPSRELQPSFVLPPQWLFSP